MYFLHLLNVFLAFAKFVFLFTYFKLKLPLTLVLILPYLYAICHEDDVKT